MKIAVATICTHFRFGGNWWSYGPFVKEMDIWTDLFDELVMVAPIEVGTPPPLWSSYRKAQKIRVVPYRLNKGVGLTQGRTAIWEIPKMMGAILKASKKTDAFHVRSPGSIGLLSSLLVPMLKKRVCAKYAGQWTGYPEEPWSVRLQRAILRSRWWRGPVTVYGLQANQPAHVIPLFTSVLSQIHMERARTALRRREISRPIRLLYVGRLSEAKNVHVLISAIHILKDQNIQIQCSIVGAGDAETRLKKQTAGLCLQGAVRFHGSVGFEQVLSFYENSDVLVLVSESEGWPKAIAEGMAFGLICVGSDRGIVPWMLGEGRGLVVPPGNAKSLAGVLREVATCPEKYKEIRIRASRWAQRFTVDQLRKALGELLTTYWGIPIGIRREQRMGTSEGKPPSNPIEQALLGSVQTEVRGWTASTRH